MASTYSFDVTTSVDLQEVDNAVNQTQKEISQRFDFKGALVEIEFKRTDSIVNLATDSDMRMEALFDALRGKLIKRGVPVKNLEIGDVKPGGGEVVRREIKEAKLKKVTASIQGDQVRVSSPDKDALQDAIAVLRKADFEVELQFGNFR